MKKISLLLLNYVFFAFLLTSFTSCNSDEPTPAPVVKGTVTDIDGNVYQTITIGDQTWMIENLRTTKYTNGESINAYYIGDTTIVSTAGDTISIKYSGNTINATCKKDPNVNAEYKADTIFVKTKGETIKIKRKSILIDFTDNELWSMYNYGAQCTYNCETTNDSIVKYGRLYNFYAVNDARNIAPKGWHVPSNAELIALQEYVKANLSTLGTYAKAFASTTNWASSNCTGAVGNDLSKNNRSGFNAFPCGYRDNNGSFVGIGTQARWWSCSKGDLVYDSWYMGLFNYHNDFVWSAENPHCGLSVRCIKDSK